MGLAFLKNILFSIVLLFGWTKGTNAQHQLDLTIDQTIEGLQWEKTYPNAQQALEAVKLVQTQLLENGYLEASIDSLQNTDSITHAFLHTGEVYQWAQLTPFNIPEEFLNASGFRGKLFDKKPIKPQQVKRLIDRLLNSFDNNGFPFARIRLKTDSITHNGLFAQIEAQAGPLVNIDSIIVKGAEVSPRFISNATKIKKGDLYNQLLFSQIETRIKELRFLRTDRSPEVVFKPDGADIYIYLKKSNANSFNGILGVLPDDDGKITFTGDIQLGLTNAFNRGERLSFHWQKLQTLTQELDIGAFFPYFLGTPFGLGGNFNLYRRDSTYLEVQPEINLRFQLPGNNYVGVFLNSYSSTLLDPERFANSTSLPQFNDTRKNTYGLELQFQNLDYALNPREGFSVYMKAGAGFKNIVPLEELDSSIYEQVRLRTNHYEIEGNASFFLPLLKRTSLMFGVKGHWLINDPIFVNEMKRLGGLKSIRGFDDQSILASSHLIGTVEYRYLLEQNSYVYAFMDYGYYENRSAESLQFNSPRSFGLGISFQTKPGIFTLSYALGRLSDTDFLLRSAKIHFGFLNFF